MVSPATFAYRSHTPLFFEKKKPKLINSFYASSNCGFVFLSCHFTKSPHYHFHFCENAFRFGFHWICSISLWIFPMNFFACIICVKIFFISFAASAPFLLLPLLHTILFVIFLIIQYNALVTTTSCCFRGFSLHLMRHINNNITSNLKTKLLNAFVYLL